MRAGRTPTGGRGLGVPTYCVCVCCCTCKCVYSCVLIRATLSLSLSLFSLSLFSLSLCPSTPLTLFPVSISLPPRAYSSPSPRTTIYAWRCNPRSRADPPPKQSSPSVCVEPDATHFSTLYRSSSLTFPHLYPRSLRHHLELTSMVTWTSSARALSRAWFSSSLPTVR